MSTPEALKRARGDVAALGAPMEPVIASGLGAAERPALERKALIDLGAAIPSAMIAGALCDIAEDAEEAWLRRYAVWALEGHAVAEGADAVVPRLMLRMKYEPDGEALGWILRTLWGFGYGAALERADGEAESLPNPAGRATLLATLAGYDGLDAPDAPASESLLGETWLWISDLSGAHFQLRGVDDARYVLSSLAPWAKRGLRRGAHGRRRLRPTSYRAGSRAHGPARRSAASSLGAALLDPNGAVRGAAADALAAVAGDAATQPACRTAGASPPPAYEDRVALARALARPPVPTSRAPWPDLRRQPGTDLKLACAGGLLRTAPPPGAPLAPRAAPILGGRPGRRGGDPRKVDHRRRRRMSRASWSQQRPRGLDVPRICRRGHPHRWRRRPVAGGHAPTRSNDSGQRARRTGTTATR